MKTISMATNNIILTCPYPLQIVFFEKSINCKVYKASEVVSMSSKFKDVCCHMLQILTSEKLEQGVKRCTGVKIVADYCCALCCLQI